MKSTNSLLTKTALQFHLKQLRADTNPRTRCDTFLAFKNTVQVIVEQHSKTALIMKNYPVLPEKIKSHINEELAAFIHAHMNSDVRNLTSSVERSDGIGRLQRLQTIHASATPADRTRALQQLNELQMHGKEAVISFVSRFQNHIQVLSNTTVNANDMPTDKELATFFLDKLCANDNMTGDVHHVLLDCRHELNSSNCQSTLTNFEDLIILAENQAFCGGNSNSRPSSANPSDRSNLICGLCGNKGHSKQVCYSNPANCTTCHQAHHIQAQPG